MNPNEISILLDSAVSSSEMVAMLTTLRHLESSVVGRNCEADKRLIGSVGCVL